MWLLSVVLLAGCKILMGPEERLRERVEGRWSAIIEEDFEGAYAYSTPAYRKANDYAKFSMQFATQIKRLNAEIAEITISEDGSNAEVIIILEFLAYPRSISGEYRGKSRLEERWIKRGREWYHLSK